MEKEAEKVGHGHGHGHRHRHRHGHDQGRGTDVMNLKPIIGTAKIPALLLVPLRDREGINY